MMSHDAEFAPEATRPATAAPADAAPAELTQAEQDAVMARAAHEYCAAMAAGEPLEECLKLRDRLEDAHQATTPASAPATHVVVPIGEAVVAQAAHAYCKAWEKWKADDGGGYHVVADTRRDLVAAHGATTPQPCEETS